jgi:hypothetical protein
VVPAGTYGIYVAGWDTSAWRNFGESFIATVRVA